MPELPPDYVETWLGDPRGALRQYRGKGNVHVREYRGYYSVHLDRADPRRSPMLHLLLDSPETLISLAFSAQISRRRGSLDGSRGIAAFLLTFFTTYKFLKFVKSLLGG